MQVSESELLAVAGIMQPSLTDAKQEDILTKHYYYFIVRRSLPNENWTTEIVKVEVYPRLYS